MSAILDKIASHGFILIAMTLCFGVMGMLFMARVRRDRRRRENEPSRHKE
jgi:uncharacterized membrane protein SpoIIM required for sporulation